MDGDPGVEGVWGDRKSARFSGVSCHQGFPLIPGPSSVQAEAVVRDRGLKGLSHAQAEAVTPKPDLAVAHDSALSSLTCKCQNSDGTLRSGRVVPHPAPKNVNKKKGSQNGLHWVSGNTLASITTNFHLSRASHLPYRSKVKNYVFVDISISIS